MSAQTTASVEAVAPPQVKTKPVWKLETPEYLLLLVIGFILWTFGFIELMNRTSTRPTILGLYSTSYFAILATYSLGYIGWIALLARPFHTAWLPKTVTAIQSRNWLAALTMGGLAGTIWTLITVQPLTAHPLSRLGELPVLRFAMVVLLMMVAAVITFGGWTQQKDAVQPWRKILAVVLAVVVVVEVVLQLLAAFNLWSAQTQIADLFVPYGKVYIEGQEMVQETLNNYGWYYPDFNTRDDAPRIALLGDTFVQALQVDKTTHFGVQLNEQMTTADQDAQVMAFGMPGFGPGLYLSDTRMQDMINQFQPAQVVLFFNLGSDFQTTTIPSENDLVYRVDADGQVSLHPDSERPIHDLKHYILDGYSLRYDPLKTLRSHYLTPRLFAGLFGNTAQPASPDAAPMDIPAFKARIVDKSPTTSTFTRINGSHLDATPGASNFMFEASPSAQAEESLAIAIGLIEATRQMLAAEGVDVKLVTIPAFPQAFYAQEDKAAWQTEIGPYDLLQPERALQAYAAEAGIDFLGLGQYLHDTQVGLDEVQGLFFDNGQGHFTPAGHAFVADALYTCFYSDGATAQTGACQLR